MGTEPRTRRIDEWLARYLPPLLLVLVALVQIYLAGAREILTPARGGGFGLFSTVDKLAHRQLRMYWVGPSGRARVALPGHPAIRRRIRSTTSLPTDENLRVIAGLMEEMGRTVAVDGEPPFPFAKVEVWKRAFDQERLRASRLKVAELVVERPE